MILAACADCGNMGLLFTDGTEGGTTTMAFPFDGDVVADWRIFAHANNVFFVVYGRGYYLYRTDGSADGTASLGSTIDNPYFAAVCRCVLCGKPPALRKTRGTPETTMIVKSISASYLTAAGGNLFFGGSEGTTGAELWVSDGTDLGTVMVKNINPSPGGNGMVSAPIAFGNRVLFVGNDGGAVGSQVWISGGTSSGTRRVNYLADQVDSSTPAFTVLGQRAFFRNSSDQQLWQTDGTEAGTTKVADGTVYNLVPVGERLYWLRSDGVHGQELMYLEAEAIPPSFTAHPQNVSVTEGLPAQFSATVTGSPPSAVRWQRSTNQGTTWSDLLEGGGVSGTVTTAMTMATTTMSMNGHWFRLFAQNSGGTAASNPAILTVESAAQPAMLELDLYAGVILTGTIGRTYRIEVADSPQGAAWVAVAAVQLTQSPQLWVDTTHPVQGHRYYRAVLVP